MVLKILMDIHTLTTKAALRIICLCKSLRYVNYMLYNVREDRGKPYFQVPTPRTEDFTLAITPTWQVSCDYYYSKTHA